MPTPPKTIKRRIVYVDHSVQKWLLIALVMLEIILIAGALWLLYLQLISAVEANLYRAHATVRPDIYPLIKVAIIGLSGLLAINLIVLWLVDCLWARHLATILRPFTELVRRVEALDFSPDEISAKPHKVVELAHAWRETERQRLRDLRAAINQLDTAGQTGLLADKERTRILLETIHDLLPD